MTLKEIAFSGIQNNNTLKQKLKTNLRETAFSGIQNNNTLKHHY